MANLSFNLSKYNTSGITYKNDNQIPKTRIKNNQIISTNSIPFKKPFKLHIRASKMVNNKRTITKKTLTFTAETTLLDAVKKAQDTYVKMMDESENRSILIKDTLKPSMTFQKVWDLYLIDKKLEYENDSTKDEYDTRTATQFFDKWLKPIASTAIKDIHRSDITKLKAKMKNKKGEPLADRTKLSIHQYVNPVYKYFNLNSSFDLKSPATITKNDKVKKNTRKFDLTNEEIKILFLELKDYPLTPYKEVFMWLMHGRRRKEVLTLEWIDIDTEKNTYTIRAINNKAKVDMTYHLTPRLKSTFEIIGIKKKGFVFKALKNPDEALSGSTVRTHWDNIETSIVMHQIRNCIATYLKNVHGASNEMAGYILGHTQSSTVTERYGTFGHMKLSDTLNLMLDEIFDDKYSKIDVIDNKLYQLQQLFPNKSIEQLKAFLDN
ncbi:MAG: tyrosine-type recombinase/integrase [Bacteroidales bacterium]|nr:tyrosine-type recombinase/integrase [Bacteroidales bacterium]